MNTPSFHILRVAIAITFLWIGILILQNPEGWGGMVFPWVANLLPSVKAAMVGTAILDLAVGALLLVDVATWFAALLGSLHLLVVLAVTGINPITIRDIGLLGGTLALFLASLPKRSAPH